MKTHHNQDNEVSLKIKSLTAGEEIHKIAVCALEHAEKHRDTSKMKRLLESLIRAKDTGLLRGLILWMRTYSPMELVGPNIKLSGRTHGNASRPFRLTAARADPIWYRKNKPKDLSPVTWTAKRRLANGRVIYAHDYGLKAFSIRP